MSTLEPRKLPRQHRSKVTVQAMLDACAESVERRGYHGLTTHAIAERAGVSVGTLYQYFPNRDAVAGALAVRALERMLNAMRQALEECMAQGLTGVPAGEHLMLTALEVMTGERAVFARLGSEAPHLFRLPAAVELQQRLIRMAQDVQLAGGDRLDMPQTDAWIVAHMVSACMLQISLLDAPAEERRRLARDVARLTGRMVLKKEGELSPPGASAAA